MSPKSAARAVAASSTADADESIKPGTQLFRLRLRLWRIMSEPGSSRLAKVVSAFIISTIVVSIVNFAVASYPQDFCRWTNSYASNAHRECSSKRLDEVPALQQIETACIMIFSAEYVLRLLTAGTVMSIRRFATEPFNILDLVAIMPWYFILVLEQLSSGGSEFGNIFAVVRVVRLLRVVRVLKASKSMTLMIVLGRTLQRSFTVLMLLFFLVGIMVSERTPRSQAQTQIFFERGSCFCQYRRVLLTPRARARAPCAQLLLFAAFAVALERGVYNPHRMQYLSYSGAEPSLLWGIPEAMYWCMATMTTVGYGDIYPTTRGGEWVGIFAQASRVARAQMLTFLWWPP